jgi:hypothetical protein
MKTLRDFFRYLPPDGRERHAFRNFNMAPKAGGRVPSVKALAESLGFAVERINLPRGVSGRLVRDPFSENGYRIEVNALDHVLRQRFSVIHELVHYYCHFDRNDPFAEVKLRDRGDHLYLAHEKREEREADAITAAIFFDCGALSAARSLHGDDLHRLSMHFGVSEEVVRIALSSGDF